jgi:hypothetical protein
MHPAECVQRVPHHDWHHLCALCERLRREADILKSLQEEDGADPSEPLAIPWLCPDYPLGLSLSIPLLSWVLLWLLPVSSRLIPWSVPG